MLRNIAKVGKHDNSSDETIENYHALMTAILTKEFHMSEHYSHLYNKEEGKKRIEEIDKIRAEGRKTELEVWWEEQKEKYMKQSRISNLKKKIRPIDIQDRFKDELVDCSKLTSIEISQYKLKVIDVETGEINTYDSREEVSKVTGISTSRITCPYIRNQYAYKGKYLITISREEE